MLVTVLMLGFAILPTGNLEFDRKGLPAIRHFENLDVRVTHSAAISLHALLDHRSLFRLPHKTDQTFGSKYGIRKEVD